jgi:catechol 2,3-dioxygenase-like lactoylglutathione lyase family enzyme
MTIQRLEHVGIVVDDLTAVTEFFVELGLELQGEGMAEGRSGPASFPAPPIVDGRSDGEGVAAVGGEPD